jgi:hypothetical protein
MEQTEQINEQHPHWGGWLREIVFDLNDGLVTTLVFIMVVSTVASTHLVLIALCEIAAGCVSMALGGYLSARTAQELLTHQIETERYEMVADGARTIQHASPVQGLQLSSTTFLSCRIHTNNAKRYRTLRSRTGWPDQRRGYTGGCQFGFIRMCWRRSVEIPARAAAIVARFLHGTSVSNPVKTAYSSPGSGSDGTTS